MHEKTGYSIKNNTWVLARERVRLYVFILVVQVTVTELY